jgi:hypothetical protein
MIKVNVRGRIAVELAPPASDEYFPFSDRVAAGGVRNWLIDWTNVNEPGAAGTMQVEATVNCRG